MLFIAHSLEFLSAYLRIKMQNFKYYIFRALLIFNKYSLNQNNTLLTSDSKHGNKCSIFGNNN